MICTFNNVAVASGVSTPPPSTPHPTPRPGIAYGCGKSNPTKTRPKNLAKLSNPTKGKQNKSTKIVKPNQGKAKKSTKIVKPNQGKGAKSHLPKYVQTTSLSWTFPAGKKTALLIYFVQPTIQGKPPTLYLYMYAKCNS